MTNHTRAQLEAMPTPELDAIAATLVMGWKPARWPSRIYWHDAGGEYTGHDSSNWSPSTSGSDMMELWDAVKNRCPASEQFHDRLWELFLIHLDLGFGVIEAYWLWHKFNPTAVTIAAILAVQEMGGGRILRNESTPAGKKIWRAVDRAAAKAPDVVKRKMGGGE